MPITFHALRRTLIALYLPGSPAPNSAHSRHSWPRVLSTLREGRDLRSSGLWAEASLLESTTLSDWANQMADHALTAVDDAFPRGWVTKLGGSAAPVMYSAGAEIPLTPWVGIVGSRKPSTEASEWVSDFAQCCATDSFTVVSGGAWGVDRLAASAALRSGGSCVEILPSGLNGSFGVAPAPHLLQLSTSAPERGFTTPMAKERNALIYSSGMLTLVVEPQFGTGGTWGGAVAALRRRLGPVYVAPFGDPQALRALINLGARPAAIDHAPADLVADASSWQPPLQPSLFGSQTVREEQARYASA